MLCTERAREIMIEIPIGVDWANRDGAQLAHWT